MVSKRALLNEKYIEPWSKCATAAKEHTGWQQEQETEATNRKKSLKFGEDFKYIANTISLNLWIYIALYQWYMTFITIAYTYFDDCF